MTLNTLSGTSTSSGNSETLQKLPVKFVKMLQSLKDAKHNAALPSGWVFEECEAPTNITKFSIAVDVEHETEDVSGRIVFLFAPEKRHSWGADIKVIAYVETGLDDNVAVSSEKSASSKVLWDRTLGVLESANRSNLQASVTKMSDEYFGARDEIEKLLPSSTNQLEYRLSWNTDSLDAAAELLAFCEVMRLFLKHQIKGRVKSALARM